MPYRACVFQHGSDYTHVHSKQIALSDTSALQLRRFALAFIHSHSGATGVFRNAFREFVG